MRIIFEEVEGEYFFEVILTPKDLETISAFGGIIRDCLWEGNGIKNINVYIRKEKESELCPSLKEKQLKAEKDSLRTYEEKCMKESPKNKRSQSLIAKRAGGKKVLKKREKNES